MSNTAGGWWSGRFSDLHLLEQPSMSLDASIRRVGGRELRQLPEVDAFLDWAGIRPGWALGYQAHAEGLFGHSRVLALLLADPFDSRLPPPVRAPVVFALDGPRSSPHRNGMPAAAQIPAGSPWLCLYFTEDPDERRWKPEDGLVRLFDLAWRHLAAEHAWRLTGRWPIDEAPHGNARPAQPEPHLLLAPLRDCT